MPRETARQKADRVLIEGRLSITSMTATSVTATVRGEGHFYQAGFDGGAWHCQCSARTDGCSHLHALRRVVAVDLDER